ncbi:NAD-dependent malic enzyme [Halanaerobiaceae bacterium Z-7014]|uniref:NAD-dependent malic enzyme n=1 Tax=Halonatronomonas betaini TaxID=2778430 RepID=A0A931F8R3_9FIRM|nr:malic enzyme-like NAD(P)-binding protein [Halonatronomonas betaini]MBF8436798.1 NAD-dependent malic enzyme [Halonatronomonas betaini]
MDIYQKSLKFHEDNKGKIEIKSKVEVNNADDLSLAYSPGVAEPCRAIAEDKDNAFRYTAKGNMIAVVSSGTAVLGLGNIGPDAAMPVMEGKAVLFKKFAGVDAVPLCLGTTDKEEIVNIVKNLEPSFAGINLEDIAAPDCFYIEEKLKEETEMAIFHDDQHGTAIVILAGLLNATKLFDKKLSNSKIVINGAGASATATVKLLLQAGVSEDNLVVCDSKGIINSDRGDLNPAKEELAKITNSANLDGGLAKAVNKADIFIGLSVGNVLSKDMVNIMNQDPIIFALANPDPEIAPELAKEAGVSIIATGRSDYPNQINNVLAFPGVMKGALIVRAKDINSEMKMAAARAIAGLIQEPDNERIVPGPFEKGVAKAVAISVAEAAMETGVARIKKSREELEKELAEVTY